MDLSNREFLEKLLATFRLEAEEHLQAIASGLVELERLPSGPQQSAVLERVFRETHSLKGAARAVNQTAIEAVCQAVESILSALKRRELPVSPELLDILHSAADTLGRSLPTSGAPAGATPTPPTAELLQALQKAQKGVFEPVFRKRQAKPENLATAAESAPASLPTEERPAPETVRISAARLNSLLLEAEEMLAVKAAAGHRLRNLRGLSAQMAPWKKERAKIGADLRALQAREAQDSQNGNAPPEVSHAKNGSHAARVLAFLDWNDAYMHSLQARLSRLRYLAEREQPALGRTVEQLLDSTKQVAMLPFSSLLNAFPKLVRDLSRDRGKQAELVIEGAEIEADRRVLERLKDPLMHLLRNCIDHGVEAPEQRVERGKPRAGRITIAVSTRDGDKVEVSVSDDGAGIDAAQLAAAATRRGMLTAEKAGELKPAEILALAFESDVSTSPIITEISGRGLGLAIVRERAETMGGRVSVETQREVGTTFRMLLPITLSTFRGVVVAVNKRLFLVPIVHVERVLRATPEEIKTVENRETVRVDGQPVSLARLGTVLGLGQANKIRPANEKLPALVLRTAENRIAFLVDEILYEQEVLVKPLGRQLSRLRNVAGATVLGDGTLVPVLNAPDLVKSAVVGSGTGAAQPSQAAPAKPKSILVAEDSITARTLLKNILEMARYRVQTAVDGVDAFTALRSGDFDLLVSDIEMPRMDGFDLTVKVRADKKLSELPVVLVTALDSREDRERGILVGANAYIVKKSFDQSNLLEIIRRLV